jgi:hypothetical protein
MIVTSNAIEYLIRGSEVANEDINAINADCVEFDAGQICTEDDNDMRQLLQLNEYQPILKISELTWNGTYSKYPNLTIMVTDGITQMMLRPSFRKAQFPKTFYGKKSPLYTGRMNVGRRLKLLDYTTSIWVDKKVIGHPCIFIEKMRAEPKRNNLYKLPRNGLI